MQEPDQVWTYLITLSPICLLLSLRAGTTVSCSTNSISPYWMLSVSLLHIRKYLTSPAVQKKSTTCEAENYKGHWIKQNFYEHHSMERKAKAKPSCSNSTHGRIYIHNNQCPSNFFKAPGIS